jgi:hypothetical protein
MPETIEFIENSKLVRIHTIADGNCLVHSFLRATLKDYADNDDEHARRIMTMRFRCLMSDYIIQAEEDYNTEESVVKLVSEQYGLEKPRNFISFLESMYDFKIEKEYMYPKDKQDKDYYKDFLEPFDESMTVEEMYKTSEEVIESRIKSLQIELEKKLGNNLYLPNKFNKGVIEAVLKGESIPEGLYKDIPFNSRIFTYCKGGNIIKITYEYNKLEDILFLRDIPRFFRSNQFIGDGDVLSLIPDMIQLNLIIIDASQRKLINIYETEKSERYIFINNIDNIHYETIGIIDEENKLNTIFEKTGEIIDKVLKTRSIDFI